MISNVKGEDAYGKCQETQSTSPVPKRSADRIAWTTIFNTHYFTKGKTTNKDYWTGLKRRDNQFYSIQNDTIMPYSDWYSGHPSGDTNREYVSIHLGNGWKYAARSKDEKYAVLCRQMPSNEMTRQCGGTLLEWKPWSDCGCHDNQHRHQRVRSCNCFV